MGLGITCVITMRGTLDVDRELYQYNTTVWIWSSLLGVLKATGPCLGATDMGTALGSTDWMAIILGPNFCSFAFEIKRAEARQAHTYCSAFLNIPQQDCSGEME